VYKSHTQANADSNLNYTFRPLSGPLNFVSSSESRSLANRHGARAGVTVTVLMKFKPRPP
jgi:hypothetical protein